MQLHIIVSNVTKKQLEKDIFFNMFILSMMYLHITVSNVTKKQLEKDVFFNMFILSITKKPIQHAQSVHYVVTHTCENYDYKATTKAILLHHVHFTHNEVKHGSSFIVTAHNGGRDSCDISVLRR